MSEAYWSCEKCGYGGGLADPADVGVYSVRIHIENAHLRCSSSCANENGLLYVRVEEER